MAAIRAPCQAAAVESAISPRLRAVRVLLVDDSAEFLAQASALVAATDSAQLVDTAASGTEALALLAGTSVDLVLMDLRLPGLDGLEATSRIKRRGAAAPKVVIVSLYDGPEYRRAAYAAGADGLLAKANLGAGFAPLLASLFARGGSGR
ncbi:MAG: response regulator transcription factor [Thermoanaerobaculia bacterium]